MSRKRSMQFEKEVIMKVVFDSDLGLTVELGDENIDNETYGYAPTQDFIGAVENEIRFQIENTIGGLSKNPTLRNAYGRFRKALDEKNQRSLI
jgi:hypothetical protein